MVTRSPTVKRRSGAAAKPGVREQSALATQANILRAATKIFAKYGYAGGSIEKISTAAKSYDRMIYYYFGSKEGLFIAVLEAMYKRMSDAELRLKLDPQQPVQAMRDIIAFVVTYYRKHPEFVTLLNTENLHKGQHIAKSGKASEYSSTAIDLIDTVLASGVAQGQFRADVRGRDVYLLIAAAGYFYMSNRHTLAAFLGENLDTSEAVEHWQRFVTESVLRSLLP
jgi:AcrR family transcriptional regulator